MVGAWLPRLSQYGLGRRIRDPHIDEKLPAFPINLATNPQHLPNALLAGIRAQDDAGRLTYGDGSHGRFINPR